ncbi:MAG: hypothetical protein HY762_09190 [Planctomycetes bacterium]|nr:hypothetical protein [Planctomycetota bacterium]
MKNLKTMWPAGKLALVLSIAVLTALAGWPFGCGKSESPQPETTQQTAAPEPKPPETPPAPLSALAPAPVPAVIGANFDNFVPDNVYVYVSVDNIAKLSDAYKQSSFGKLWNDPEIKKFTEKAVELLQKEFTKNVTKETDITFKDITSLAEVFCGQAAFVLDRIELKNTKKQTRKMVFGPDGQPVFDEQTQSYKYEDVEVDDVEPVPYLMLMAEVTKNREKLDGLLEKITKSAAEDGALKKEESYKGATYFTFYHKQESTNLSYGYIDNIFFINYGDKSLKRIIDAYKQPAEIKALSARPAYQKITANAGAGRLATFYVNIPPFISMIKSFIVKEELRYKSQTPEEMDEFNKKFDKVIDSCGLGGFKSIIGTYRAEGSNFIADGLFEMPGAGKGIIAALTGDATAEFKTIKAAPADTMMYLSGAVSFPKLYDGIMDTIAGVMPREEYEKEVKADIRKTEEKLGLKIKEDILSLFGNEIAFIINSNQTALTPETMMMGASPFNMAFVLPIAKPEAVKNVHTQIIKLISEDNEGKTPFVEKQYSGFTFYIMELPDRHMEGQPPMPAEAREIMGYFFTKDMFVYAMPAANLKIIADTLSGKNTGSLATNPDFAKLAARNKVAEKSLMLSYTNLEKYMADMLSMAVQLMESGRMAPAMLEDADDPDDDNPDENAPGDKPPVPAVQEDKFAKLMKEMPKLDTLKKYFIGWKALSQLYPTPDGIMWRSFTQMGPE